ncbi:hypothetical protein N879_02645 [Alcaligenes sp. EGD-AK7]|nr:hypothetical protein N879_02645 [Alcaligenes sp. EGD-AK7]
MIDRLLIKGTTNCSMKQHQEIHKAQRFTAEKIKKNILKSHAPINLENINRTDKQ